MGLVEPIEQYPEIILYNLSDNCTRGCRIRVEYDGCPVPAYPQCRTRYHRVARASRTRWRRVARGSAYAQLLEDLVPLDDGEWHVYRTLGGAEWRGLGDSGTVRAIAARSGRWTSDQRYDRGGSYRHARQSDIRTSRPVTRTGYGGGRLRAGYGSVTTDKNGAEMGRRHGRRRTYET